jgi:hypothetical protein
MFWKMSPTPCTRWTTPSKKKSRPSTAISYIDFSLAAIHKRWIEYLEDLLHAFCDTAVSRGLNPDWIKLAAESRAKWLIQEVGNFPDFPGKKDQGRPPRKRVTTSKFKKRKS